MLTEASLAPLEFPDSPFLQHLVLCFSYLKKTYEEGHVHLFLGLEHGSL